jgi:hypothetical protein
MSNICPEDFPCNSVCQEQRQNEEHARQQFMAWLREYVFPNSCHHGRCFLADTVVPMGGDLLGGVSEANDAVDAASTVSSRDAPLAGVIEGHPAGQGFTGVFDSSTRRIALNPSSYARPLPEGQVFARGGHGVLSRALGGEASNHYGFTAILREDGSLELRWRSGTLNSAFPSSEVPTGMRSTIANAVQQSTGRTVHY